MFTSHVGRRTLFALAASLTLGTFTLLGTARVEAQAVRRAAEDRHHRHRQDRRRARAPLGEGRARGVRVVAPSRGAAGSRQGARAEGARGHAERSRCVRQRRARLVPYGAMPQIGEDLRAELAGKVIIDTSNPDTGRDGAQAAEWQKKGAGVSTARAAAQQPRRARVQLHSGRVAREQRQPSARAACDPDRRRRFGGAR